MSAAPDTSPGGGSEARVRAAADRLGLAISVRRMDRSTRTAEDAARACGSDVAQIVKSLVFEDAEAHDLVLLLVSGRHNADLEHIRARHGVALRRCTPRRVREETGFAIGGVAPIGHMRAMRVLMDETLLAHATVWCAAGRPDSVFAVEPRALAEATDAALIDMRAG